MITNNNVITAITLIERMRPMLHERDRVPIQAHHLKQIQQRLVSVLEMVSGEVTSPLVLIPFGEIISLIDTLLAEPHFVETTAEVKELICGKVDSALEQLYLFAGKYYETHEFDYSIGLDTILQKIVDMNVQSGYYFGFGG